MDGFRAAPAFGKDGTKLPALGGQADKKCNELHFSRALLESLKSTSYGKQNEFPVNSVFLLPDVTLCSINPTTLDKDEGNSNVRTQGR
jgi:hypothetical protein